MGVKYNHYCTLNLILKSDLINQLEIFLIIRLGNSTSLIIFLIYKLGSVDEI